MTDHGALIERLEAVEEVSDLHGGPAYALRDLLDEAAAALRDLTGWRDIATAPTQKAVLAWLHLPKNPMASGPVLAQRVYYDGFPHEEDARYREGCWWANSRYYAPEDDGGYVTHWLPLPSAPNQAKEAGE